MTPTNSPGVRRGSACLRGLIPAQCWRDAYASALTTAGVLAALVFGWLALLGVAALTRPLGLLIFHLSQGGNL